MIERFDLVRSSECWICGKVDFRVIFPDHTKLIDSVGEVVELDGEEEISRQESEDKDENPSEPVGSRSEEEDVIAVDSGGE